MKQRPTTATELHTGSWWLVVTLVVCCLGSPRQTWLKILGFNYMDNKLHVIERSARIPQEENLGITIIHHSLFAKGVSFLWTYHSDEMFLVARMKHDLMTKLSLPEKKTLLLSFFESAGSTFEVLKRADLHFNNVACCDRKLSESVCQNEGVAQAARIAKCTISWLYLFVFRNLLFVVWSGL